MFLSIRTIVSHMTLLENFGAEVFLKRAPEGTGVIAGGPARSVVELPVLTTSVQNH